MFAQGNCDLLDLKNVVNMGRCVHMTIYRVVPSGSDPYGRHFCDQIALRLYTNSCVCKNLQSSYLTWLSLVESVLTRIELSDGALNQHQLLSKLKERNVSFVDGRELNRTLLQLVLLARSMFDANCRERFWGLERAFGKDVFSVGNSEKLRRLMLASKRHADVCSNLSSSDLLGWLLSLMHAWLALGLRKTFPTTSLTAKDRSWVDLAVKSFRVVLYVYNRVSLRALVPDHPILAVVEKFKSGDFLECLTQPVPPMTSAEVLEAEEGVESDSFEDEPGESFARRTRAKLSNILNSMAFGPEQSSASKLGTFLLQVVLGGYHGDLLQFRDVSEYFSNDHQVSAMKNDFASALCDILSVIDKEGQVRPSSEVTMPLSAGPALAPESYLQGNFELLVLKFCGKGKKGRRIQDLDETVRKSIAGPPSMTGSDGKPLKPVLFVFTGDCFKEDPYMPWSRPTRSITKHDDLMVSDIFNYIHQSLQDILWSVILE